jgi:hypothetical protein
MMIDHDPDTYKRRAWKRGDRGKEMNFEMVIWLLFIKSFKWVFLLHNTSFQCPNSC